MKFEVQTINIDGIECYEKDGVVYLKLEAVARGLGFTQTQVKNGKEYVSVRWERVEQYLAEIGFPHKWGKDDFIPENVFYRLAMKANNETAERFQAKIADEVVPSIRKHGAYMTDDTINRMIASPEFGIKLLTELKAEQDKRKALETENSRQRKEIETFKPIKRYVDTILASKSTMATTQIAADYGMTANRLNQILKTAGVQRKVNGQWVLRTQYLGRGFTDSQTIQFTHSDGTPDSRVNTRWTQNGRLFIHDILTKLGIPAVMDKQTN